METTFEQRALWWKIKALNGLNDFENALNLLQENNKKTITNQRLAFLFNLERLVSMANLDAENIVIRSLEKEICADLPEDKGAFEYSEFDEARLDACLIQSDVEILEILSRLIFRYKEDRLLAKLAKSLIRQGEIYSKNKGHKDAAIAFSEAAALIAENQYFGLRVHLLKAAHRYDGRYSENNYHAIFDEFNQASRYLDIEPLGRGGQGQVSKALDLFTGKLCAIKRFRIEDTNRAKEFTYNEIRTGLKILSRTQSDRILSVRDFFLLSNELHAVAPLGSGTEISDTEVLNMTKSERFELCIQILDLVEEIHFAGIIHNDLKPQNFLLNHETGIVEIIDFGISRLSDEFSISSTVVGTNKFMAPEILRGDEEPNFSSDVYSLGVIFKNWLPAAESFLPKFLRKKSDYKKLINQMLHTNQEERPEINFIKRRFQEMLEELIRGHSQRKG
jgi:hypothetical protein